MNRLQTVAQTTLSTMGSFAAALIIYAGGIPSSLQISAHAVYFMGFLAGGLLVSWSGRAEQSPAEDKNPFVYHLEMAGVGAIVCTVGAYLSGLNPDLAFIGIFAAIMGLCPFAVTSLVEILRRQARPSRTALIVGANERGAKLAGALKKAGWRVLGVLDNDEVRAREFAKSGVLWFGGTSSFDLLVCDKQIDGVYLALPFASQYGIARAIVRSCEDRRIPVYVCTDVIPLRIARNRPGYILDVPILTLSSTPEKRVTLALKRLIDLAVSSAMLVALGPFLLAMAIIIKLDSKGPVFFYQERVARHGRRFKMIKFRSMVVDAEARRAALEKLNEADGPVFKIRNDPRITRIGAFIRKYSIDEFPQLINVWKGEMSLVGPRPPIPSEVIEYTWSQRRRLSVKPGMTGLWQVSGRSNIAFAEWVRLDLMYIDSWGLKLDFLILLRTFRAVVQGRGAA